MGFHRAGKKKKAHVESWRHRWAEPTSSTMASVGTEVSVGALSTTGSFWPFSQLYGFRKRGRGGQVEPTGKRSPLGGGANVWPWTGRCQPVVCRFCAHRRAAERAGRCCAPEREWSVRTRRVPWMWSWPCMVQARVTALSLPVSNGSKQTSCASGLAPTNNQVIVPAECRLAVRCCSS